MKQRDYVEWFPSDQNQTYGYPGKPDSVLKECMNALLGWIDSREESNIGIVCHWGVI